MCAPVLIETVGTVKDTMVDAMCRGGLPEDTSGLLRDNGGISFNLWARS